MTPKKDTNAIPAEVLAEDYFKALHKAYEQMHATFARLQREDGLTQDEIARRLGINKSLVSRRLHGRANLTFRIMSALATAMDCELVVSFKPFKDLAAASPRSAESAGGIGGSHRDVPSSVGSRIIRNDAETVPVANPTMTPHHLADKPMTAAETPRPHGVLRLVTKRAA